MRAFRTLLLFLSLALFLGCSQSDDESSEPVVPVEQYGVRWSIKNPDDLGRRCFSAASTQAIIGIGTKAGYSDFDHIYPWSEIKRCNIRMTGASPVITYEGDPAFRADGSNGDVFVRIPKFYVKKYTEDGYEYRVVSAKGTRPHSAFIEDGKELDEIFVSAYEGFIDADGKLRSIPDVIPTSNCYPFEYLDAARANGPNYSLYDMRCVDAIWTLMAVEYGCRNSNHVLGYGAADFAQPRADETGIGVSEPATATNQVTLYPAPSYVQSLMPVGTNITICRNHDQLDIVAQRKILQISQTADNRTLLRFDGPPIDVDRTCFVGGAAITTGFIDNCGPHSRLTWHTGRTDFVPGSNMQNPVRYRWMENLIGSLWQLLPDVTFKDLQMYVCPNMKDYEFHKSELPYKPVGRPFEMNWDNGIHGDIPGNSYWITSLFSDSAAPDYPLGTAYNRNLISTHAFGAYYYIGDGTRCIANGGGFDHLWRCNILTNRAWIGPFTRWYLYGARLMYKNLPTTP